MKFIELFAGIGGFRYGLEVCNIRPVELANSERSGKRNNVKNELQQRKRLDYMCVYANEFNKYAASIYERNYGDKPDTRDIREVGANEIPDHDLLTAGFPCQSFSIAGKRGGFEDTRGTLFFEIARIARDKTPKYLLLENVKGLISHNEGKTLEIILETLQELGYYTNIEVYNSKNFGVPQNRERIFFICRHIKTLLEDGQNQKTTISKTIIQEYLFQILLNNLAEVKKLQEHNSKDLVVGYLLLKEINQNLNQSGENILGGIWTPTEEKSCRLKEEVWQNTDTWLSKNLGENYQELNKSTILTVIKQIIESKTYTYSQMQKAILLAIVHLRESSKDLWNEVLSSLIVFQENTNYERVNVEKEKVVITEGRDAYIGEGYNSARERVFIVGHLRGTRRPQVFPIGQDDNPLTTKGGKQASDAVVSRTLTATDAKMHLDGNYVLKQIVGGSQGYRVYDPKGISSTLAGEAGGIGAKTGLYAVPVLTPDRAEKRQNGRRFKEDGDPSFTLTGQDKHGVFDGTKIRRLTSTECCRLQSFPDNWTKYGLEEVSLAEYNKGYGDAEKRDPTEILRVLWETIKEIKGEGWGTTEFITLFEKEVLQQGVHVREFQRSLEGKPAGTAGELQGKAISGCDRMWEMWLDQELGCSPQRQKQIEQLFIQLRGSLQKLSQQHPSWKPSRIVSISDTQKYKCLGNAVTTNVITAIGERLQNFKN